MNRSTLILFFAIALSACTADTSDSSEAGLDAAGTELDARFDASPPSDAGDRDASPAPDGGPMEDARRVSDLGLADAGDEDATPALDGGPVEDGGVSDLGSVDTGDGPRPSEPNDGAVPLEDAGAVDSAQLEADDAGAMDALVIDPPDSTADGSVVEPDSGAADSDAAVDDMGWIYPACDVACCPGFPWRRPGGFWTDLAGHTPDWRPVENAACVFALQRDDCQRITGYTLGRDDCNPDDCDGCRLNLNEFRRQIGYAFDERGHLTREGYTVQRHIDWADTTSIQHVYDEQGLRVRTTGLFLPEEDRPRSVYLRYQHDERGRLIREEAVDEPFMEFEPVPWVPTRISTFSYGEQTVEESLDSDGDGVVDQVLVHPIELP